MDFVVVCLGLAVALILGLLALYIRMALRLEITERKLQNTAGTLGETLQQLERANTDYRLLREEYLSAQNRNQRLETAIIQNATRRMITESASHPFGRAPSVQPELTEPPSGAEQTGPEPPSSTLWDHLKGASDESQ